MTERALQSSRGQPASISPPRSGPLRPSGTARLPSAPREIAQVIIHFTREGEDHLVADPLHEGDAAYLATVVMGLSNPAPATARCLVPAATPGILALSDCPFHSLPQRAPELMCHINQSFIDGLLRGLGNKTVSAAGLQVGRRLRLAPCAGPLEGDCVLLTSATRVQAFRAARCWFQGRGNPGSGWPPGLASGGGGPRGGPWPWCRSSSPSAALTLQGLTQLLTLS